MNWFKKLVPTRIRTDTKSRRSVPEGVWTKCSGCNAILYRAELDRNMHVCPKCSRHMRLGARDRLNLFLDSGSMVEIGENIEPVDVLKFRDSKKYRDRIASAQKATEEKDALVVMRGTLKGLPVAACAFEFRFMGGSMGSVVGEKFVRAANVSLEENIPLICFSASAETKCGNPGCIFTFGE